MLQTSSPYPDNSETQTGMKNPYVMYEEPNQLYEEIKCRLEHYNKELEALEFRVNQVRLMRDVLVQAHGAFDRENQPTVYPVPSRGD